jgi:hypothetical protein
MTISFETLERAQTIVFSSPLLTLAASVCDMLEKAGIPAVLCREHGSPIVVVPPEQAAETRQLLRLAWAGLS